MNKRILIILSTFYTYTHIETSQPTICTYSNNDQSPAITISVDQEFVIKLPSNPSTGYAWDFISQPDSDLLTLIDKQYEQEKVPSRFVGHGGNDVWHFKATQPGKTQVNFIYKRPWEQTSDGQKKYSALITIEDKQEII